jgi:hypothetical protein
MRAAQRRPWAGLAGDDAGEQHGRRGGRGQGPTCGSRWPRRGFASRAGMGRSSAAVVGVHVRCRPAVRELGDVPLLARELLERQVPPGVHTTLAGRVSLPADDQQVPGRGDRPHPIARVDRENLRRAAGTQPGGDAAGLDRLQPGEVGATVPLRVYTGPGGASKNPVWTGRRRLRRRQLQQLRVSVHNDVTCERSSASSSASVGMPVWFSTAEPYGQPDDPSWARHRSNTLRSRWASYSLMPSSAQSARVSRAIARNASRNVPTENPASFVAARSSNRSGPNGAHRLLQTGGTAGAGPGSVEVREERIGPGCYWHGSAQADGHN